MNRTSPLRSARKPRSVNDAGLFIAAVVATVAGLVLVLVNTYQY